MDPDGYGSELWGGGGGNRFKWLRNCCLVKHDCLMQRLTVKRGIFEIRPLQGTALSFSQQIWTVCKLA